MTPHKTSLFSSTLRVFFAAFAVVVGIAVALTLICIGIALIPEGLKTPSKGEMYIHPDADGNRSLLSDTSPVILRINIHGVVGDYGLTKAKIEKILLDALESPLKKERIKGILLHIKSPGGVAFEADGIYMALKAFKAKLEIPIYAFVDGICASGGVVISSAADQIYSAPASIVGSVGVIMGPVFNFYEGMGKLGIKSLTLTDGKDKDMLNPFRPWKEGEDASLKAIISSYYNRFVHILTTSRPRIDKEKLINVYGAHIFDNEKAKEYGFIDVADSSYSEALSDLAKAGKIDPNSKYQVVEVKATEPFLKQLLEERNSILKGKITHTLDSGPYFKPEFNGKPLYLYTGFAN